MLRRTLALATLVSTLLLLLFFALGDPARSLFASTLQQADESDESTPLSQPITVTVRQQIPFTITLLTTEVVTQGATVTDTVIRPLTQTTVITFEVESTLLVSSTGVMTTPLSVRLRSTQSPTTPFPVKSSLVLARNLLAELGVELPPLPEPSEELTATESLTDTESLTTTEEITVSEDLTSSVELTVTTPITESPDVTTTAEISETGELTATDEVTTSAPITFNATLIALSNIRSETNLEATSIITQLAAGTPISVVAQSADQSWLLLDSGYWVSVLVVDALPAGLQTATDAQIAALREASATPVETSTVEIPATPEPEATVVPTVTVEATIETTATVAATPEIASGPTVTVDANLRSGPGTGFDVIGGTITGQAINIVGRNADSTWYRLDNGGWVAAQLVANAPASADIPIVNDDGSPINAAPAVPTPTEEPFALPTPTPTP